MATPRPISATLRDQATGEPLPGAVASFRAIDLLVDEDGVYPPTSVSVTADDAESATPGQIDFELCPGRWVAQLPGARPATFRVPEGVGALTLEALLLGSGAYVPPSQADTFQELIDAAIAAVEGATLSDAIPQPLGTAAAGDDAEGARGDHIHAMPTAAQVGAATAGDIATHAADTTAVHGIADTSALVLTNDARLADARTPTAHAASHITGGSDVIASAVAGGVAGLMTGADKTKLDGVATGATANATDAQLRDRATHTGEQAISTVTGLQGALDAKAASSHTHPAADVWADVSISFTANGSAYYVAARAMTFASATAGGSGTLDYAKALAADTTAFSATSLPVTLATGDVLRVTVSTITTYKSVTLVRSA